MTDHIDIGPTAQDAGVKRKVALRSASLSTLILFLCVFAASALETHSAQVFGGDVQLTKDWRGRLIVKIGLSEPLPYAIRVADEPRRAIIRLDGAVMAAKDDPLPTGTELVFTKDGPLIVVDLDRPRGLTRAAMSQTDDGGAQLEIVLATTDAETFEIEAARSSAATMPDLPMTLAEPNQLHVMLDPGHGGFDPGAEYDGVREADLVLIMADLVRDMLVDAGVAVSMTREDDSFVSLPERVARANRAGADVFVSLHADAVSVGHATGASVHSLPEEAGDASNLFLLHRLGQDALGSTSAPIRDETVRVLLDLARAEAQNRGAALADRLVAVIGSAGIDLYKTPRKQSNFVVLRAADMASVLVELGFLSEPQDRARLVDPVWRTQMARAISTGILDWARAN